MPSVSGVSAAISERRGRAGGVEQRVPQFGQRRKVRLGELGQLDDRLVEEKKKKKEKEIRVLDGAEQSDLPVLSTTVSLDVVPEETHSHPHGTKAVPVHSLLASVHDQVELRPSPAQKAQDKP